MKYGNASTPKWDGCCSKPSCDMEQEDMEMDMCGMGMGMPMDMGMSCNCPPKMDCKVEKECVKTFVCRYKLYRICMYRLFKVCPRCNREFDYHGHRGMCPHCR